MKIAKVKKAAGKAAKRLGNVSLPKPKLKMRSKRPRPSCEYDPAGIGLAVREFNEHIGPARIFYNRFSESFEVMCYDEGSDRWWSPNFCNSPDKVELYRKTTEMGDIEVTADELAMMLDEIPDHYGGI